jgi:threonine synthase
MVAAFARGADAIVPGDVVEHPSGIAEAILMGDPTAPYPYVAKIVRESGGAISAVDEREIRDAQRALFEHEGIRACFSASAAVAGVLAGARRGLFARGERILLNVSGRDRAPSTVSASSSTRWLVRAGATWVPS